MIRSVAKLQYKDKLYPTFKPGMSTAHPMARAFDKANSGMVFQSAYLLDTKSFPLLALYYADASFSGQSMSYHPIYSTLIYFLYILYPIGPTPGPTAAHITGAARLSLPPHHHSASDRDMHTLRPPAASARFAPLSHAHARPRNRSGPPFKGANDPSLLGHHSLDPPL
jgi:hypothetical protein